MKRTLSSVHTSKALPTVVRLPETKPLDQAISFFFKFIHRLLYLSFYFSTIPHSQVIKIGTSSLIRPQQNCLNLTSLASIVETVRDLKNEGYHVILVSSGAVGVGCQRLGLDTRPSELARKQALAAVGQVHLMRYYDDLFSACGLTCSQVLLTLDNIANRGQYLNAANTLSALLDYGVVPVINENDTVAVEQLSIGDNDTLSAQVATIVQASWLFLLTDVDALYTANPSKDPDAQPIHNVRDLFSLDVDTSTKGTQWGTGGMATKLTAARIATTGGCHTVISHFSKPENVLKIIRGEQVGTVIHAHAAPAKGRKRWVLSVPVKGEVWLDPGAVRAVRDRRCSLFSAGVIHVVGEFQPHDVVCVCDGKGQEFGRGMINMSHTDVIKVRGMSSRNFYKTLGQHHGDEEIIHRINLCLLVNKGNSTGHVSLDSDDDDDDDDESGLSPAGLSRSQTPVVGALQGAGGSGSAIMCKIEEDAAAAAAVAEVDVRARLELLTSRAESGEANWQAEAAAAAQAERKTDLLMRGAGGGKNGGGEDVNEDGWMPK
jgi:glutamate 5-kinase